MEVGSNVHTRVVLSFGCHRQYIALDTNNLYHIRNFSWWCDVFFPKWKSVPIFNIPYEDLYQRTHTKNILLRFCPTHLHCFWCGVLLSRSQNENILSGWIAVYKVTSPIVRLWTSPKSRSTPSGRRAVHKVTALYLVVEVFTKWQHSIRL